MNNDLILQLLMVLLSCSMTIVVIKDIQMRQAQREAFAVIFIAVAVVTSLSIFAELLYGTYSNRTIANVLKTVEIVSEPFFAVLFANKAFRTHDYPAANILMWVLCGASATTCIYTMATAGQSVIAGDGVTKAELYPVFAIVWVLSASYVVIKATLFSRHFQFKGSPLLITVIGFEVMGIALQLFGVSMRFEIMTSLVCLILLYSHSTNVQRDTDRLTALLNQGCWHNTISHLRDNAVIIIFDLNDLKKINDQHGHQTGDRVIKTVSDVLRRVYMPYGYCYRIGGDEFAVLVRRNLENYDKMIQKMIEELIKVREKDPLISRVSYGVMEYDPAYHNIYTVIEDADKQMYEFKTLSKQHINEPEKTLAGPQ